MATRLQKPLMCGLGGQEDGLLPRQRSDKRNPSPGPTWGVSDKTLLNSHGDKGHGDAPSYLQDSVTITFE